MMKAIIFDMDGVLVDSESRHYPVIQALMEECGFHYTIEHLQRYCGVPEKEIWPQLLAEAGLDANPDELQRKHWSATGMTLIRTDCPPSRERPNFCRR